MSRRDLVGALALTTGTLAGCAVDGEVRPDGGDPGGHAGTDGPVTDRADGGEPRLVTATYGGPGTDALVGVARTADGHLVAGRRTRPTSGDTGWALSLAPDERARWQRTYRSPDHRREDTGDVDDGLVGDRFAFAVPAESGALLVGATYDDGPAAEHAWAVRVDDAGDVQWERRYRNEGANSFRDTFADGRRTAAGGYLLAGRTLGGYAGDESTGEGWLLRIDANGRPIRDRAYNPAGRPHEDFADDQAHDAFAALAPADGGSLLAGRTTAEDGAASGWLVWVDDAGDVRRQRTVGDGAGVTRLADVARTDGGHVAVGTAETGDGETTGVAFGVDEGGQVRWDRQLGDALEAVVATPDGTLVAGALDGVGLVGTLGPAGAITGTVAAGTAGSRFADVAPAGDGHVLVGRAADDAGEADGLVVWMPAAALDGSEA